MADVLIWYKTVVFEVSKCEKLLPLPPIGWCSGELQSSTLLGWLLFQTPHPY